MDETEVIVTSEAAALRLGVSRMQITRLVRAGKLHPLPFRSTKGKPGRPPYRFPPAELDRYLRERDNEYPARYPRMAFYAASA